jgi:hypothetical protein
MIRDGRSECVPAIGARGRRRDRATRASVVGDATRPIPGMWDLWFA